MTIQRLDTGDRMSQVVIHGNTVYTAGQVAANAQGGTVTAQTEDILKSIDALLERAGSNRSKLLTANIWLANMADFDEMNAVWDAWVPAGQAPCRACVESRLAFPKYTVEIMVTAALD